MERELLDILNAFEAGKLNVIQVHKKIIQLHDNAIHHLEIDYINLAKKLNKLENN